MIRLDRGRPKGGTMSRISMRQVVLASGVAYMLSLTTAFVAHAQTTTLVGLIRDSTEHGIPGVEVWLRGSGLFAHTSDAGGFRIANAPVGAVKVSVRRMGFEQTTVDLTLRAGQTDSLIVALNAVAATLAGVTVEDEAM